MKAELTALYDHLQTKRPDRVKTLLGFDGFVDEVIHIVETRYDTQRYDRIDQMRDFGQKIIDAGNLSRNFEFVTIRKKIGGNGPNMAQSLMNCGCNVTYIGALGKPAINPVFYEFSQKSRIVSISEPGHTQAIEFHDGKLICSNLESLYAVNPDSLREAIDPGVLADWISDCDFLGFENWTLVIHMTDLWKYLLNEVLPLVSAKGEKQPLFIDLADPEKRDKADIQEVLGVIRSFESYFRVTLGLNLKEACEIADVTGCRLQKEQDPAELAGQIRDRLGIETIVVHTVSAAYSAGPKGNYQINGPYCERPVLTTGAGDNFNAGYMLGRALDLEEKECLYLGAANSGFYVRNGKSADFDELKMFIQLWKDRKLDPEQKGEE